MTVRGRVLHRAAELAGGKLALCLRLGVSVSELRGWMEGRDSPPTDVFLKAVDLINAFDDAGAGEADRSRAMRTHLLAGGPPGEARRRQLGMREFASKRYDDGQAGELMDDALDVLVSSTGATRGTIQIAGGQGLRIVAQLGFSRAFLEYFALVDGGSSVCGRASLDCHRVVVADVREDAALAGTVAGMVIQDAGALAVQSTPLLGAEGRVVGVISTHYDRPHQPSPAELLMVDRVAARVGAWLQGVHLYGARILVEAAGIELRS